MHPRLRNLLLTATALLALGAAPGVAGPEGPSVVGGAATVVGAGTASVLVNQSSSRAIVNWHTFNIGAGERVQFNQPGSSSVVLNRVTGGLGPSQIFGTLTANGRVFVINRDGVLFGAGSVINTAGFLASTNDIRNSDFMAGRYNFNIPGRPDASIVNLGKITATSGGFAALVAPGVRNSGTITATLGTVALAAGNSFTLDMYGDKLITLAVNDQIASQVIDVATGKPLKSLVTNDGTIRANGGRVELTAAAARTVVDSVINTSGVIRANTIGRHNGMIVLSAATGASKPAGAPRQTVKVSGTLSAAGKKPGTTGGTILVTGEDIKFVGALVDASGRAGGGKVMIGGDWGGGKPASGLVNNQSAKLESYAIATATTVSVDAGTTINASAIESGHGGKVVLWSDNQTNFAGTILARGGDSGGNGGFVETSSHGVVQMSGLADLRAPQGSFGTLLLDPADLYIDPVGGPTRPPGATVLTNVFVQNQLALGNFVVATDNSSNPSGQNGDIFVTAAVTWNTDTTLTLSAFRDINVNPSGSGVMISNTAGGNLILRADSTGTGIGTVNLAAYTFSNRIDWSGSTGNVQIFYNPASYSSPTNFTTGNGRVTTNGSIPDQLTAYMLVNSVGNLNNISTNLAGTYALGRSIDGGSQSIASIGSVSTPFTGLLEGQGHSISNLTVQTTGTGDTATGIFASIGAAGIVRNLALSNIAVNANPNITGPGQFLGTLAGISSGTIANVHVTNSTVDGDTQSGVIAGGLVGQLQSGGTIAQSSTNMVHVTTGDAISGAQMNNVGGLVGVVQSGASITQSSAENSFITTGLNTFAGGLVGRNDGTILNSMSSNAVLGASGAGPNDIGSAIGGLAGFSSGLISGSSASGLVGGTSDPGSQFAVLVGGLVGLHNAPGQIINSHASGTVIGVGKIELGGLVGANFAQISQSWATGLVGGTGMGQIGGLVGVNGVTVVNSVTMVGSITDSYASGPVFGSESVAVGGLAGENSAGASISNSFATGAVIVTAMGATDYVAGGLVGENSGLINNSHATGSVIGIGGDALLGGLAGSNEGTINNSFATGSVAIDTTSRGVAGGLVGGSDGLITGFSFATGAVSVNAADLATAGGFVGINLGSIDRGYALGSVNVAGGAAVAGGFVGINLGFLSQTFAVGAVTGSATFNVLGGHTGLNTNIGGIQHAFATGAVTGTGTSVIGGLAGVNLGTLDQTFAVGKLAGGTTTGGLVGANTSAPLGALSGEEDLQPFLGGTGTATNSYWDTRTTGVSSSAGGTGRTSNELLAGLPQGFDPAVWSGQPNPSYPHFAWQPADTIPTAQPQPPPPPQPPPHPNEPMPDLVQPQQQQAQIIENLVQNVQLAALNTDPVISLTALTPRTPQQPQRAVPANPYLPPGFERRIFDVPPLTETRFIKDEVLLQISTNVTVERVQEAVRRFGLTLIEHQSLGTTTGSIALRFRIGDGQSLRDIIRRLASVQILAVAQPIYVYVAGQDPAADPASRGAPAQQGDAAQYILQKLKLTDVHRIVKGTNVPIAVIDSEIDAAHPDLVGVIAQRFSAAGAPEKAHPHGTGMAGAIASRQRLLGVAPSARLLAVHAFSSNAAKPESTTYNILKGLDWSVKEGARIINMSFAGPKDPSLERSLKAAYDKGIVLIAAAGNAGPRSPPLYPGADKNVIAVTATDVDDKLFAGANRGGYVAVAAPGVDILVPAPDAGYQLTTGTSVAAAEVSGVVALLLERNPRLKPADIRRILTTSAKRLGPGERNDDFGSGLIDPLNALQAADPRTAGTPPPRR